MEKTLKSPLDCKEIQPVYPKGDQSWVFTGRTDAEAEAPILLSPDVKNWLIGKDPDAGKDWRWEEKGMTEDETVRWHHRLDGHEFEQAPGVGDGQGGLACCSPWDCRVYSLHEVLQRHYWANDLSSNLEYHLFFTLNNRKFPLLKILLISLLKSNSSHEILGILAMLVNYKNIFNISLLSSAIYCFTDITHFIGLFSL